MEKESPVDRHEVIEKVAMIIYYHENGVYPVEYHRATGVQQPSWESIPETRKDEFRVQSREAISFLLYNGILRM